MKRGDIAAGKAIVNAYLETPEGKAALAKGKEDRAQMLRELEAAFATFKFRKDCLDNKLAAHGFGPFADDEERYVTMCDLVGVSQVEIRIGELYQKVTSWLERKKIEASLSRTSKSTDRASKRIKKAGRPVSAKTEAILECLAKGMKDRQEIATVVSKKTNEQCSVQSVSTAMNRYKTRGKRHTN